MIQNVLFFPTSSSLLTHLLYTVTIDGIATNPLLDSEPDFWRGGYMKDTPRYSYYTGDMDSIRRWEDLYVLPLGGVLRIEDREVITTAIENTWVGAGKSVLELILCFWIKTFINMVVIMVLIITFVNQKLNNLCTFYKVRSTKLNSNLHQSFTLISGKLDYSMTLYGRDRRWIEGEE